MGIGVGAHGNQVPDKGLHAPITWRFADATARLAFTPTEGLPQFEAQLRTDDLQKWAIQDDNSTLWRLTGIAPLAWTAVSFGTSVNHVINHEAGGADELDVTGLSGLLADPQTPLAHAGTHGDGQPDEIDVTGLSGLLADPQTPAVHGSTHGDGQPDEIDVTDLSGLLADPQTPLAHALSHQNGQFDELDVTGLSGLLADPQTPLAHFHSAADLTSGTLPDARVAASNVTQHNGALDHGLLLGLGDDDHSIYPLANGSRGFSAPVSGVTPTLPAHLVTKGYADALAQGAEWQDSVLDWIATPPVAPSAGDRYLVLTGATGVWAPHVDEVAEWDGAAYIYTLPTEGMVVVIDSLAGSSTGSTYRYASATWVTMGSLFPHDSLIGSGTKTHAQIDTHLNATGNTHGATAVQIPFTPDGDIASTDVQTAVVELRNDTDTKLALYQLLSGKNAASGYAGLDGSSKLTGSQQKYGTAANTAAEGNDSRLSDSRAPTGSAGGDLTGTYPNPTVANNKITDAQLRDSAALSVIGRSANSGGDPADITTSASSGAVLRESGGVLGFGTVAAAGIASDAVITAKILDANVTLAKIVSATAQYKFLVRTSSGSGPFEEGSLSAFILTLLDDADALTARTTLGAAPRLLTVQVVNASSATVDADADVVLVTYVSGTCTLTMRGTSDHPVGKEVRIQKANTSAFGIVLTPDSGAAINGGSANATSTPPVFTVPSSTTTADIAVTALRTGSTDWRFA